MKLGNFPSMSMENKTNSKIKVTHSNRASRLRKQFAASTLSLLALGNSPSGPHISQRPAGPQMDASQKPVGDRSQSTTRMKPVVAAQHIRSRTLSPNRAPRTFTAGTVRGLGKSLTAGEVKSGVVGCGTANGKPKPKPILKKTAPQTSKDESKNKPQAMPKRPIAPKTVAPRGVSVPAQAPKSRGVKPDPKPSMGTAAFRSHSICTTRPKVLGNEPKKPNAGPAKVGPKPNPIFFTTVAKKQSLKKDAPFPPTARVEPTRPEPEMIRRRRTYITNRSKSQLAKLKGLSPGEEPVTLNPDDLDPKSESTESNQMLEIPLQTESHSSKPKGFNFNPTHQELEGSPSMTDITDSSGMADRVSNFFANLKESSSPGSDSGSAFNSLRVEPKCNLKMETLSDDPIKSQKPPPVHFPSKSEFEGLTPTEVVKKLYQFYDQLTPETETAVDGPQLEEKQDDQNHSELAGPKPNVEITYEEPNQSDDMPPSLPDRSQSSSLSSREAKTYLPVPESDPIVDDGTTTPKDSSPSIDELPRSEGEEDVERDMQFDPVSDEESRDSGSKGNIGDFPDVLEDATKHLSSDHEWSNHTASFQGLCLRTNIGIQFFRITR